MPGPNPDEVQFTEDGAEQLSSVASAMATVLPAAGPPGVALAAMIGVAAFIVGVINWMRNDTTMPDALRSLQNQIDEVKFVLNMLDERLDELVMQVALETNRSTLRDLNDYLDEVKNLETRLVNNPQDIDTAVDVANECGVLIDKFLRNDFEIWRWTDVVKKISLDAHTGMQSSEPALKIGCFKNLPTMPVYLLGVFTWLAARELVVQAGQTAQLADDSPRITRHLNAVSVRDIFDKYRSDNAGTPVTIAENIRARIRAFVTAYTRYPENRTCRFYFDVQNWMNGKREVGDDFNLLMGADNVLCTVDPLSLGTPNLELAMETEAGVEVLRELAVTLGRVAVRGTLREQFIGTFPTTEVFPPATLYVIAQNDDLHWYRNESSSQPGGSSSWEGPKKVGNGWGGFTTVFNGGGVANYGIQPDGTLLWYGHDGFVDGSPSWRGPHEVGHGWQNFKSVFSGGEYVVYGIKPDGRLLWYRHDGAPTGGDFTTWAGPTEVGTSWHSFVKVFSGGDGIIYAIRPDGVLLRYVHKSYLTGAPDWEPHEEIGTGWGGFQAIVAGPDGVIYAFTRDGRILWYRYGTRTAPAAQPPPARGGDDHGGLFRPAPHGQLSTHPILFWEGPVEIKHGLPGFKSVFARRDAPFNPVH